MSTANPILLENARTGPKFTFPPLSLERASATSPNGAMTVSPKDDRSTGLRVSKLSRSPIGSLFLGGPTNEPVYVALIPRDDIDALL